MTIFSTVVAVSFAACAVGFSTTPSSRNVRSMIMSEKPTKGAGFNYDPSNYKDSNSGNYRRLSDQLAAKKAEEDALMRERDELMKKERMAAMILKQEADLFWNTPGDKIVANNEKFFVPPEVLQVISDLDNQLIGLKPVRSRSSIRLRNLMFL